MIKQKKPNKSYTSLDVGPLPQVGQTVNSNPEGHNQYTYKNLPGPERASVFGQLSDYREDNHLTHAKLLKDTTHLPTKLLDVSSLHAKLSGVHVADQDKVEKYTKWLQDNPEKHMDPVFVRGERFFDGGHRVRAYHTAGRKTIPAIDVEPLWKKYAYTVNSNPEGHNPKPTVSMLSDYEEIKLLTKTE